MSGKGLSFMLLVLMAGGCRTVPGRTERGGHLEVRWNGPGAGKISGPATAEWCAPRRLLEIRTVQGDTGIALALYPAETLVAGVYRVTDPTRAESVPPAAGIALRWLGPTAVQGFRGDSGTVDLARSSSGQLSGNVQARARSVVDNQRVALTGTFRDLTVVPGSRGCAAADTSDKDAERGDTGIH